jgi:hypothetical protein
MAFQVVPPLSTHRGLKEGQARIDPRTGRITIHRRLLAAVGINGWVLVLWDPDARRLALRKTSGDEPNAVKVSPDGTSTARSRISHKRAAQVAGLTRTATRPATPDAGMIVIDVGKETPDGR